MSAVAGGAGDAGSSGGRLGSRAKRPSIQIVAAVISSAAITTQ